MIEQYHSSLAKHQRLAKWQNHNHGGRNLSRILWRFDVLQPAIPADRTILLPGRLRFITIGISKSGTHIFEAEGTKRTNDKQPNAQYDPITSQLTRNYCDISNKAWSASNSVYSPSSQDFNPTNGVDLDKNLQTLELNQVSSSKDTEKRRMQNRNSQNAHRQRNKKLIEDLHQEVAEFSKYSLEMYHTLQELKETTKALVMTIDQALGMHPPPIRQDYSNLRRPST